MPDNIDGHENVAFRSQGLRRRPASRDSAFTADPEPVRAGRHRALLRGQELLRLVAAGQTNRQIARQLGISEGTVRTHLENIFARLQVSSRTAAVTRAFPDQAAGSHTP